MPVKRVQSFEFYGADAQPKPARKGVERVPMGEGSVKGGIPGPYYTSPCFLLAPISPVVKWSASRAGLICRRTEVQISAKLKNKVQLN